LLTQNSRALSQKYNQPKPSARSSSSFSFFFFFLTLARHLVQVRKGARAQGAKSAVCSQRKRRRKKKIEKP